MSAKGQAYEAFIIKELEKGNVSFEKVFTLFYTKFHLTRKTFSKYWKLANRTYSERLQSIKEQKEAIILESAKEAAKERIATAEDKRRKLWDLVLNDKTKPGDKIRAINELNRMDGDHSAQKVENTIKGKYDDLTDEQIRAEIERLKDI